jgi:hypothetical protein
MSDMRASALLSLQKLPEARALIASARRLTDLDRYDQATAHLEQATRLLTHPAMLLARAAVGERIEAVRELALLLERTNRIAGLRKLLDNVEALGISREQIGLPSAAIALEDGRAEEAKRLLLLESPDRFPVRWHRLMVRVADALGDFDDAFAAASEMKRRVKAYRTWRQRAAEHLEWVRRLAAAIAPEWTSRLPVLQDAGRKSPAFLVGFPRSGTTLLDTFLMGHRDMAVVEEKGMIGAAQATLGDISMLPERSPAELERARNAYFAELDHHAAPHLRSLVLDKLPLNMIAAPLIHCLFPDARMIFAQRHPCDVVLSCFMQGFALNDSMACFLDLATAAAYYDAAMSVWMRTRRALPLKQHIVVYEELVAGPEATLRPAIEFLGLEWRQELLAHEKTARARGAISTPSYNQVTQPLSLAPIGRWRRYEKQLAPVLPVLLPWAERLGYTD